MKNIVFDHVVKAYDKNVIVKDLNMEIREGERLILLGPSGCGKSTTLRMIAGLERLSGGNLYMDGRLVNDVPCGERNVSMVFQNYALFPHMTVQNNIIYGLKAHKMDPAEIKTRLSEVLDMLDLKGLEDRRPKDLSGGQRQRASLARGLALKPSLLIADEPTSALDVSVQAKVLELFKRLQAEIGFACLFITHDLAVVDMLADRIMVMHKGQIVEHGDADQIMQHPENPYTKKLLASLPVPDPREQQQHRAHLHELLAQEA